MLTYTVTPGYGAGLGWGLGSAALMPTLVKGTDFVCSASICYSKNYKQKDAIDALFKELQHQINEFAQVVNSRTPFSGFVPLKLDGFIGAGTVALLTKAVMALPINTMRFGAMPGETWAGTSKEGLAGSADKWVVDLKNAIIQMTTPGGPPVPPPSPGTTAQQQADATVAEAQRVAAANELAKRQAATDAQIAALQAGLTVAQQKAAADAAVAAESARQQAAAAAAGQQQPGQKPTGQPGASNTLWWALGGGAILVLVVGGFFAAKATRRPDPAPSIAGGYGMWTPRPEPKHACPAGEFWTRGRCKRILWR